MYQRRFKNKTSRRIFHLKGRFSLMHLGGGTFLYSFPGRHHPIVGKIEFGGRRSRNRGLGALAFGSSAFVLMSLISGQGKADPITQINELKRLEAEGRFIEFEQRSDELKSRLVSVAEDRELSGKAGQTRVLQYRVKEGVDRKSVV